MTFAIKYIISHIGNSSSKHNKSNLYLYGQKIRYRSCDYEFYLINYSLLRRDDCANHCSKCNFGSINQHFSNATSLSPSRIWQPKFWHILDVLLCHSWSNHDCNHILHRIKSNQWSSFTLPTIRDVSNNSPSNWGIIRWHRTYPFSRQVIHNLSIIIFNPKWPAEVSLSAGFFIKKVYYFLLFIYHLDII